MCVCFCVCLCVCVCVCARVVACVCVGGGWQPSADYPPDEVVRFILKGLQYNNLPEPNTGVCVFHCVCFCVCV